MPKSLSEGEAQALLDFRKSDIGQLIERQMIESVMDTLLSIPTPLQGYTPEQAAAQGNAARGKAEQWNALFRASLVEEHQPPTETFE